MRPGGPAWWGRGNPRSPHRLHCKRYFFGACGAVHGVTCDGFPGPEAAIQAWGGCPPRFDGTCALLGTTKTANCTLVPATRTGPGMRCRYTGGSEGRSVDVHYNCSSTAGIHTRAEERPHNEYVITVSGPGMCGHPTRGSDGAGGSSTHG